MRSFGEGTLAKGGYPESQSQYPNRVRAMVGRFQGWRKSVLGLVALGVWAALPAAASAEDLYFRNDTAVPLIIQGSCINPLTGRVVNDRPNLVQPGGKVRIALPGNKQIFFREARAPNRLIHKEDVVAGKDDMYVLVKPDPAAKLKFEKTTAKEFAGKK
jgi:hypothetical protein